MTVAVTPIGCVRGGRSEPIDDDWGAVEATIALDPAVVDPDATLGLDAFSHVTVLFHFDRLSPDKIQRGARRPRGNPAWPMVGILAQRGAPRPNRLGITTCELLGVDGLTVRVRGLDAIDGTPILDIKPHMTGFAPRGAVREPAWVGELMAGYWTGPS